MGNTHVKRGLNDETGTDGFATASPPQSPGSPLTYSPQISMEPMPKADDFGFRQQTDFSSVAGWPAQPKLVPTSIIWSHGGNHVEVEGSFDNWTKRHTMEKSGKDFTIVKLLPPGVYQYKFIVDGEWRYATDQRAMYDERRNVNNVLEVREYAPENLDNIVGFEPPPSPPASYNQPMPTPEDYAKEPPAMPPHLQLTLLNVPPALDAAAALPRPQHVILNHLYVQRSHSSVNALVVGTTQRYRSKYVTTVLYKPAHRLQKGVPPSADPGFAPGRGPPSAPQFIPGHQS